LGVLVTAAIGISLMVLIFIGNCRAGMTARLINVSEQLAHRVLLLVELTSRVLRAKHVRLV
jgi:hypothetical protein